MNEQIFSDTFILIFVIILGLITIILMLFDSKIITTKKIKQFFCRHEYEKMDNEPLPTPKEDYYILVRKLHKCKKCGKIRYFGSGWIFNFCNSNDTSRRTSMNIEENILFGIDFTKIKQFFCRHEYLEDTECIREITNYSKSGKSLVEIPYICVKCGKTKKVLKWMYILKDDENENYKRDKN